MATIKTNDKKNSQSPESVICEILSVIKNDKEAADSRASALRILKESKETVRTYKICSLDKAEQSYDFYQDIRTSIALNSHKKSIIIQKNVDEYIKKDVEIEKLIKESSVLLNDLRIKMTDASNEACVMYNCLKNKILSKKDESGNGDVATTLDHIMSETKKLNEMGLNAFDSVVTLAGIQMFNNTGSLKDFVPTFVDKVKIFKEYVDGNIKSTNEEVNSSILELNSVTEELTQVNCDNQAEKNVSNSMDYMIKFICDREYEEEYLDLCNQIKSCFDNNEEDKYYHLQSENKSENRIQ